MTRNDYKFEICADRVELCAGIPEGGTTPSYGEIKIAQRVLTTTRLHVIIRPRGGDFLYSPLELERMAADIDMARELGADGVVFGCLRPDGSLDTEANAMLMQHAKGMSVTFHRAFDRCAHPHQALEELISQGFDRILTSGQQPTALEGTPLLKEQAKGRIILLAGCGVNEQNIATIAQATHIHEFHFSARTAVKSQMLFSNPDVYMGAKDADEDTLNITSSQRVAHTIEVCLKGV